MTTQNLPLLTITLYCREWEQEIDKKCPKIEVNGSTYSVTTNTRAVPIPELGGEFRTNHSCFRFLYVLATYFRGRTRATVKEAARGHGVADGDPSTYPKKLTSFHKNWGPRLLGSRVQFEASAEGNVAWPGITFVIKNVSVETPDEGSTLVSSNRAPPDAGSTTDRFTPTARAIAGLYGADQQRVLESLAKLRAASPSEKESYKAQLDLIAESRKRASQDGSMLSVLRDYYTPLAGGFLFYDLLVGAKRVRTLIATQAAWILDIPIALDEIQCQFIDDPSLLSIPLPNVHRTASILHDVELLGRKLVSKPLYRLLSVAWADAQKPRISLQFSKDWYVRYHLTWGQLPEEGFSALFQTPEAEVGLAAIVRGLRVEGSVRGSEAPNRSLELLGS